MQNVKPFDRFLSCLDYGMTNRNNDKSRLRWGFLFQVKP